MSSEAEWKVVTRQDKRRVMKSRRKVHHSKSNTSYSKREAIVFEGLSDKEKLVKAISTCMEHLLQTDFFKTFVEKWNDEKKNVVQQIVCYGIGNFSIAEYSAPMWQLALVLCIRKFFLFAKKTRTSEWQLLLEHQRQGEVDDDQQFPLVYFDPCITSVEAEVLGKLNIEILAINERGKRSVNDMPTLFFMPHCPAGLYNNVLWANWDSLLSIPVIIFGNSLCTYTDLAKLGSQQELNGLHCMKLVMPWLREEAVTYSKQDLQEMAGNFEGAFNDCYVTYFTDIEETEQNWPNRPPLTMIETDDEVV